MTLRVLHCISSLNDHDGGPARSVPALAEAQAVQGADVRVWSCQQPTIDLEKYQNTQFVTGRLSSTISDRWSPDVIHDHGLWLRSNHLSAAAARGSGIPRVVSPRGMLEPWCLQHRRYRKAIAWKIYQHRDLSTTSCLHATSPSELAQFRRLGLRQPVILLPNGVSLPPASPVLDASHPTAEAGPREVLFLSRIHPVKGLPVLIEAWQNVAQPHWRLRIVGSDEDGHRDEIRDLVRRKQLGNTVSICDAVHSRDKWQLLRSADLLVLPSFSENFGIVVAEALAAGTPVVTTTGTPWVNVVREQCGWYVEPTAQMLSQALRDAMGRSRAELQQMGSRGEQWVRREFAWDDIGEKMLGAYEWLLGRGQCVDCVHTDSGYRQAG